MWAFLAELLSHSCPPTLPLLILYHSVLRLYSEEVAKSSHLQQTLGLGIGLFQGLSNAALNGIVLGTLYLGGYLMARRDIQPGDLIYVSSENRKMQVRERGATISFKALAWEGLPARSSFPSVWIMPTTHQLC